MADIMGVLSGLMEAKAEPEDYVGEDGLLYCGKCHTPKQTRIGCNPATGAKGETIVRTACQCQQRANEIEEQRKVQDRFNYSMVHRREDGISCPDGLRYTFAWDDRKHPKVSDACKRYVECWDEMKENNIWVLFYGSVGTGKSFLASCIGNALLDRQVPVAATNFPRLLNLLQGTYEKQALLDRLSITSS